MGSQRSGHLLTQVQTAREKERNRAGKKNSMCCAPAGAKNAGLTESLWGAALPPPRMAMATGGSSDLTAQGLGGAHRAQWLQGATKELTAYSLA